MHLAFVIARYFPYGGAQRDFKALAEEMSLRGHQITVITTAWAGDFPKGWKMHLIESKAKTNHGLNWDLSQAVLSLKQTASFDCVIGFTRLLGLDVYFAADESFVANRFKGVKKWLPRYRTYARIERELFQSSHLKVLYLTEQQKQDYESVHPQNEAAVMPVCIEPRFEYSEERYQAARQWRAEFPETKDKILLLFVAKDFQTKGLDRVLSALGQLDAEKQKRFALWILGDGKQKPYQKALTSLKGVTVQFFGGRADTEQFYLAADYLVHPARKEAAGMVIAEALASKLPILVSDICGYAFLAEDDSASNVLKIEGIDSDLAEKLQDIAQKEVHSRGNGSSSIAFQSRALFCADKITEWCET